MYKLAHPIAILTGMLLVGCSTQPTAPTPPSQAAAPEATAAVASAASAPAEVTAAQAAPTASKSEIVCRSEKPTGSRLGKKVCRTRGDMQKNEEVAKETMRDIERKSTAGIGGGS